MFQTGTDLAALGHGQLVTRQQQRRAHQWLAQLSDQQLRHRMIRHTDADGAPLGMLQAARCLARRRQQERERTRRRGLQQPELPGFNLGIAANLGQVTTHQREMMVLVGIAQAPQALQRILVTNVAAQRIAAVGGIGDQATLAQDLRGLTDQA